MTPQPVGPTRERARWRSPVAGVAGLGSVGVLYLGLAVAFFVFASWEPSSDSDLAVVGGVALVIALSMFCQAVACYWVRTGKWQGPRRLAAAGGWLIVAAVAGVAALVVLGGPGLACIAAALVLPLPPLFLWLTYGTIHKVSPRR